MSENFLEKYVDGAPEFFHSRAFFTKLDVIRLKKILTKKKQYVNIYSSRGDNKKQIKNFLPLMTLQRKEDKKMFNIILLLSLCIALVINFMKQITKKEISGFDVLLSCFIILSFCVLF